MKIAQDPANYPSQHSKPAPDSINGKPLPPGTTTTHGTLTAQPMRGDGLDLTDEKPPIRWGHTRDTGHMGLHGFRDQRGRKRPAVSQADIFDRSMHPKGNTWTDPWCTKEGNEVEIAFGNSSADVVEIEDFKWTRHEYAQSVLDNQKATGGIPLVELEDGSYTSADCLVTFGKTGVVRWFFGLLGKPGADKVKPCKPGTVCKHYTEERDARRAIHAAEQERIKTRIEGTDPAVVQARAIKAALQEMGK